jgi:hypothetical protein
MSGNADEHSDQHAVTTNGNGRSGEYIVGPNGSNGHAASNGNGNGSDGHDVANANGHEDGSAVHQNGTDSPTSAPPEPERAGS